MNVVYSLISMLKADFLERTRRYSFLVTICLVIYLGYAVGAGQVIIMLGDYRGIYNSAWVGSLMSLVITFFLGLFGFYLVKNTIQRDEQTGVGQIIATTPLTRPQYLLGKWLSNFVVLTTIVAILAFAAIPIQMVFREDVNIQLWSLMAPFLFIALPMMALVSALAVFFETINWLKGGFGNLVYFILFNLIFVMGIELTKAPWLDVIGFNLVATDMKTIVYSTFPAYDNSFTLSMASSQPLETFTWQGLQWTPLLILERFLWVVISVGITLSGSFFFNRFDPATSRYKSKQKIHPPENSIVEEKANSNTNGLVTASLTSFALDYAFHNNYLRLIWLECLLLVKGLKWYWLAGMAVLWIGCVASPSEDIRKYWFMMIAIWPVLIWSKMGEREVHYQVEQLIFQAAYPLRRLLISAWLAGVMVTAAVTSAYPLGRLIHGDSISLLPWVLSVLFIPTLASFLGVWTRTSKVFEVVYPILWYLGPFNKESQLAILDYLGLHSQAPVNTSPILFTGFILLLLMLIVIGRRRQIIL